MALRRVHVVGGAVSPGSDAKFSADRVVHRVRQVWTSVQPVVQRRWN